MFIVKIKVQQRRKKLSAGCFETRDKGIYRWSAKHFCAPLGATHKPQASPTQLAILHH
jgi:hypothetical protein